MGSFREKKEQTTILAQKNNVLRAMMILRYLEKQQAVNNDNKNHKSNFPKCMIITCTGQKPKANTLESGTNKRTLTQSILLQYCST